MTLTYCNASRGTCAINYMGNPVVCSICKSRVRAMAQEAELPIVALESQPGHEDPAVNESLDQALSEGVQSGITSTFRTLPADSDSVRVVRRIKQRYQKTARGLLNSMRSVVRSIRPERLEVFSGRHACSRFVLIAAREANVKFNTLEITSTRRPIIFDGHTPHDRKQIQRRMVSHQPDMALAGRYFQQRQRPTENKYARGYDCAFKRGLMPHDTIAKKIAVLSQQPGRVWRARERMGVAIRRLCQRC